MIRPVLPITGCCLSLLFASFSLAQFPPYDPGPAPTIGDIQHECVAEYPEPRDRTNIGIGEDVNLWIDTNTWKDPDYAHDEYGNETDAYDTLGEIIWTVTDGEGTVYPSVGDMVTLTAGLAETDNTINVEATILDSGFLGVDVPPEKKTKALNAMTPSGLQGIARGNKKLSEPGNKQIGAKTIFGLQAKPTSVNFKKVEFKIRWVAYTWNWPNPDEAVVTYTAGDIAEHDVEDKKSTEFTLPSYFQIYATLGLKSKTVLLKDSDYKDLTGVNIPLMHHFKATTGWREYATSTLKPSVVGSTLKSLLTHVSESTLVGGEQGPYDDSGTEFANVTVATSK